MTEAGFDKEKAEAILDTLGESGESLATKVDLRDLEQRLTIRLGGLVAAGVAILAVPGSIHAIGANVTSVLAPEHSSL